MIVDHSPADFHFQVSNGVGISFASHQVNRNHIKEYSTAAIRELALRIRIHPGKGLSVIIADITFHISLV